MDPLLRQLELSLSVNNFYAGGFLQADDIHTFASNSDTLNSQMDLVKEFADKNYLKLNVK